MIKNAKSQEKQDKLSKELEAEIEAINKKYADMKHQKLNELKGANKEKVKLKRENIKKVITKVRRSVSRRASKQASRGMTPKKFKDSDKKIGSDSFNLTSFAAMDKNSQEGDGSSGINLSNMFFVNEPITIQERTPNKFSESYKIQKGPINMNDLVAKFEKTNDEASP